MVTPQQTGLHCLAAVLRHHGLNSSPERLAADYAVGSEPVSTAVMLRMAREAGLRVRRARFGRAELARLGGAYPALALLENGNWVVVLGAGQSQQGEDIVHLFLEHLQLLVGSILAAHGETVIFS